jgi:PAS domain S-box-containing protein
MLENSVERERFHDLTHFIANLEWRVGEFNFFQSLVKKLAEVAAIEYAFIGRLLDGADEIEIEILAVFAHGKVAKIFCYALAGTPCEKIIEKAFCTFKADVQKLFPSDEILIDQGVAGYSGIPLLDHNDKPLELISIMTTKPIETVEFIEALIQTCAIRASSEVLRLNWEYELRVSERQFRSIFEDSSIGMTNVDTDGRFLSVNRVFCDFIGCSNSELLKLYVSELAAPNEAKKPAGIRRKFIDGKMKSEAIKKYYEKKSNETVWARVNRLLIKKLDGSVRCVDGQIEDITK